MPGLFGALRIDGRPFDPQAARSLLTRMSEPLRHRDDYHVDLALDAATGRAIGRIGLKRIHPHDWPNETRGKQHFVAGEIRGWSQKSPSRLPESLASLHGGFALLEVNWDSREATLAVDRRGSRPVFYYIHDHTLYFAPEVKAVLAALPDAQLSPDMGAWAMMLSTGHLLGDQTCFAEVKRLPGGHALMLRGDSVKLERYWQFLPGSQADSTSEAELSEELESRVRQSIARSMGDPEKTVIFLSGGTDSRAILMGALDAVGGDGSRLHTVSWGEHAETESGDVQIARAIAERYHLNHRFIPRSLADYPRAFGRAHELLDGLSDVAAFHPGELGIMERLCDSGYERVLRGDEIFGWNTRAYCLEDALALVRLRRCSELQLLDAVLKRDAYINVCDASDQCINRLADEYGGFEPSTARDALYFDHRLQGYLNNAAYFKQVLLHHGNPLLDELILDVLPRVPAHLRVDKLLFRRLVAKMSPELWSFGLAKRDNLEDWDRLLGTPTAIRHYVMDELGDTNSGIWEYFDRQSLVLLLQGIDPNANASDESPGSLQRVRKALRSQVFALTPKLAASMYTKKAKKTLRAPDLLMRVLTLKRWHDRWMTKRRSHAALAIA